MWPPVPFRESPHRHPTRGSAPLVGSLLVVGLAVVVATVAATALVGVDTAPEPAPTAAVELSVDGDTLRFTHESGDTLDVRTLSVRILVDGEPLAHQPPVPFFSSTGFEPGPTGPFNSASDPEWSAGETASLTVASTNSPTIESGSIVSVRLTTDAGRVIRLETEA
ncbi:type IV pilin [Halohasta salina]|uniref:type IV pilin n=1 Tax=Halohasta salina TaxID=2961621 RepID=UPI002112DB63|nr:type IV pilin [Halohasta salina]